MSTYKSIFVSDDYDGYESGTQIQSIDGSVKIFGESAFASLEDAVAAGIKNAVIRVATGKYEETDSDGNIQFYIADAKGNVSAANQVVFVNFDGGTGLSYDNGAYSRTVDMTPSGYSAEEQTQIIDALNDLNVENGVVFTASQAVVAAVSSYSTVNVGSTDDFDDLGDFKGLSETVDTNNEIKNDEAFVNTNNISSVEDVIEVIDHEAGHLVGEAHEETTGTIEDFAASGGGSLYYIDADGTEKSVYMDTVTVISADSDSAVTWNAGWYVVGADYNSDGTINAADAEYALAEGLQTSFTLSAGATAKGAVKLILADGFTLSSTGTDNAAGITVSGSSNSFTVYGQTNQSGTLNATGGSYGAGIGGGKQADGTNITINGGIVNAQGNSGKTYEYGAGIGGGFRGDGTNITINGGTVTATGGESGAGIGGGYHGVGTSITINGGTVTSTGGADGAGIGGGSQAGSASSNIKINGGSVTAVGGDNEYHVIDAIGAGFEDDYSGTYSKIYVSEDLILKADNNNPPTTEIAHTSSQDLSGTLHGNRYAVINTPIITVKDKDGKTVGTYDQMADAIGAVTADNLPVSIVVTGSSNVGITETATNEGTEFTVAGTYNISGTEWANLGYLQLNPSKETSETRYVLNVKNSNLIMTKPQLRGSSDLNITDSHVDFAVQSGASSGYLFAFKDSKVTVTNSVVGYDTNQGNSSEVVAGQTSTKTNGEMKSLIYGTFTATNSTIFTFGGDTRTDAFSIYDKGLGEFTDSVLYANHITVGAWENRDERATVGRDDKIATLSLNNSKIYSNNGDAHGLLIGSTKAGALTMTNNSLIDYTGIDATVNSNGSISMDATSKITVKSITNEGTITVDMTDATAAVYKLIDANAESDYGTYDFATGKGNGYTLTVSNNEDLIAINASKIDMTTLVVDASWSTTKSYGDEVTVGGKTYYYGFNAFSSMTDAFNAGNDTTTKIALQSNTSEVNEATATVKSDITVSGDYTIEVAGKYNLVNDGTTTRKSVTFAAGETIDAGDATRTYTVYLGSGSGTYSGINVNLNGAFSGHQLYVSYGSQVNVGNTGSIDATGAVMLHGATNDGNQSAVVQSEGGIYVTGTNGSWSVDNPQFKAQNYLAIWGGTVSFKDTFAQVGGAQNGGDYLSMSYYKDDADGPRALNLDNSTLTVFTDSASADAGYASFADGSTVTLSNASKLIVAKNVTVDTASSIAMDYTSQINFGGTWSNAGSITVDMTDAAKSSYLLINYTGSGTMTLADYGTLSFASGTGTDYKFTVIDNDLYAVQKTYVAQITTAQGTTKYETLADAVAAVQDGQTITLLAGISDTTAIATQTDVAFTIDLAGFSYDNTATLTNNGTVTITDSTAPAEKNHFTVGSWTNAADSTLTANSSVAFQSNDYVKGVGTVNINNDATIKKTATGGSDNGGLKADGGTLTVNVAENIDLYSNTMAVGSDNKVVMTAHNTTIHGTEYAEIFNAESGGSIQINAEGAAQNLKIKSETNDNVGLRAYINADLKVYGLESLDVTRTTANRGVNAVYASSGSTVTINTAGDALNTTISAKGGQMDENSGSNAAAMALFASWYTGSEEAGNKKFATLNAHGIKSVKAEASGLYGQAFAVYETYGSTLTVNSDANTTATGEISAKAEYYSNAVVAAGGSVSIYGIKDINSLATGNETRGIKGTAIGVNAYGETQYSSPNTKAYLTINSANAAHDTSISAKSTSADDPSSSWDAYAMGVYSYKEAAVDLNGIKDITSEAKGVAYGLYSYSTTEGKVNDVDIDMAGKLSATTTNDGGESYGVYSLYYSDIDIEGNGTAEIKATASGADSSAYAVTAALGADVTLNNLAAITAEGTTAVSVYGSGADAEINVNGQSAASKTAITGDVYAEDGAAVNLKNVAVTGNVEEIQDTSTYGTVKFTGTNTVDGAVSLQGNKSFTAAADSFSLTETGTDAADVIAINGNLSVSGEGTSVAIAGTTTAKASITGTVTNSADSTLNLSNATVAESLTNNGTATLENVNTTKGWTLAAGSVTYTNSLTNGTDLTAMTYTGTVNGTIYASSGTLDLRGVDLRVKGEPAIYGGTAENPETLDTLKATRVFFGDSYDGGGNQTIKNIVLENEKNAYRAALGVYYDTLTVDTVSVNADEGWYWDQQYQDYNYQMYTGFGGTLNIKKSLTTGEYMNAGYGAGGTGITNLAAGATINCLDFQNTGNVTAETKAAGSVHVNGAGATLNAAALNNHAITTFGTVNLTSHPVHTTTTCGLYNVNYGTDAELTIGQLNFLNKQGDTTKNQMRFGDNAVTTIGGLSTNPEVGADFYITETADTSINKAGGNAVQFTGDIVFTTYANADSSGAKFSLNLDSSDDYFTGAVKGTVSASNRWGKWSSAVMGDEVASSEHITGMTLSVSNGAVWNVTEDSFVNNLTIANASVNMTKDETISFSDTWSNSGTLTVDMTGATANAYKLVDYTGTGTVSSYGAVALDNNDGGYITTVIANDLYAIKSSAAVAKIGDNYYHTMSAALEDVKANETITLLQPVGILTEETAAFSTGKNYTFDLNDYTYITSGDVTDSITFEDATTKFTAKDITNTNMTIQGSTEVEATGTFTNNGVLNMDIAGLVIANTWSGSTGTINVTYTGDLTETIYKLVDQNATTGVPTQVSDYGTVTFNEAATVSGYTLAIDGGDLVLKKNGASAATQTGEVGADITITNGTNTETYVSQSVENDPTYKVTLEATESASEMKVTGDVSSDKTTINNAGDTVHVTRDVTSSVTSSIAGGGTTTITTSGTKANSTVEVGGMVSGSTVEITNEKTSGTATVSAANGFVSTGNATIKNSGNGDLTITGDIASTDTTNGKVTITNTATGDNGDVVINGKIVAKEVKIVNETAHGISASGKIEAVDVIIENNKATTTNEGTINLTQSIEAAGSIDITNGNTNDTDNGVIHMGGTTEEDKHTAEGGLVIVNAVENVINGSGSEATEDEKAAIIEVKEAVDITNNGHINADITTDSTVYIKNTSVNTLIGSYDGSTIELNNAGGVAKNITLTAQDGVVSIYDDGTGAQGGQVQNATINADTLYMGGTSVEITGGTILNEGSNIYIQYANEAAFPDTPVDGAVLTITGDKTVGADIKADDLDGTLYGTVKMNGTQTYTGEVAGKNISIESGADVTMSSLTFDFGTLTIAGKLNIDYDTLDSYTEAGIVNGEGTLNITNAGTWIVNDSVYRNFSNFAGTVTMTDTSTIVMGIGDAPTDTALTAAKSYIGDDSTMVVDGNSKVFLSGDGVTTGIKFTGNGTMYVGEYDRETGALSTLGSSDFTQTLTEDNSEFTGTMNIGEGATVTLEGNFGGNVNLNYNTVTTAATTLQLNATGVEVAGAITGDSNDIIDVDENATLSAASALNAFSGEVAVASEKALTLSNSNTTAAKFTGAGEIIANTADHAQTLTAEGALDGFSGTITLGGNEIALNAANTTAAKFTGTTDAVIDADAKQTLTVEGALDGFSGTVELEDNEIELDAANSTAAKFTGTVDSKINVDATLTLSAAAGALNDFKGTVELEGNTINLNNSNSTAAKFTGTTAATINANVANTSQGLTADGALNDFKGTVSIGTADVSLEGTNETAAKFTGDAEGGLLMDDTTQTLTAEGALDGFNGSLTLGENGTLILNAANETAAKFASDTSSATIQAVNADQTFSGDLSGFEGTIDANGTSVVTLSGTVADTLNLKGNEVVLADAVAHTGAINVNANTALTTLTTNDNAVDVKSGTITNVTADEGAVTVSGATVTTVSTEEGDVAVSSGSVGTINTTGEASGEGDVSITGGSVTTAINTVAGDVTVSGGTVAAITTTGATAGLGDVTVSGGTVSSITTAAGDIDLTAYAQPATKFTTLKTTDGTIYLNAAKPITVNTTFDGNLDYTVNADPTAAGLTYKGAALTYTKEINVTADVNRFSTGYTLIDTDNGLTLANDYEISLTVGSDYDTIAVGQAVKIGSTFYQLSLVDNKDLVLKSLGTASDIVYVNENWTAQPYAEVTDTYYNEEPEEGYPTRNIGYDAAVSIDNAITYVAADSDGKGTIELTENKTYAVSTALGTAGNGVTNMTLQARDGNPTNTYNAKVTGDINAGTATTLNLSHLTATGSVIGAGTVNITGTKINRFSGATIAAGGNLNITGGTYTSRYIAGGSLNAAAATDTSVTITGTADRTSISGSVYGGNIVTSGSVTQTKAASVTVDTVGENKVYIAGNIYAGGLKRGGSLTVSGDRSVTFTGSGSNLSFTGRVSGAAQGGTVTGGTATLNFTDFSGKFNGSISDFNTMALSGNTALSLGRRQTLTKNTNLTFSVTSTTSSASGTAMYTVRDKNAWEFGKSITVTADSSTQSGTYTLVGNYAAGFDGFTFTVANQSYTLGTVTTDNEGNTYVVTAAGDKLQLTFGNHLDSVVIEDPEVTSAANKKTVIYATDKNGAELTQAENVEKITATAGATVVFDDDDKKELLDDNAAGVLLYKEDNTNDIKWVGNGDTANVSGGLSGNSMDISGKTVNIDTATLTTVTANDDAAIILGGTSASTSTINTVTVAAGKTLTINVGDNATVNGNTISGTNGTVVITNTGTLTANVVNDVVVISNASFNSLYGTYGNADTTTSVTIANTGKVENATFSGATVTLNDAVNGGALGYYNNVTVNADTLDLNLSLANWAGTLSSDATSAYSFANSEAVTNYSITIDETTSFGSNAALNILSGSNYANTTFTVNGETKKLGDTFTVGDVTYELNEYNGDVYIFKGEMPMVDMSTLLVDSSYVGKSLFEEIKIGEKTYYYGVNAFSSAKTAMESVTADTTTVQVTGTVTEDVLTPVMTLGSNVVLTGSGTINWTISGNDSKAPDTDGMVYIRSDNNTSMRKFTISEGMTVNVPYTEGKKNGAFYIGYSGNTPAELVVNGELNTYVLYTGTSSKLTVNGTGSLNTGSEDLIVRQHAVAVIDGTNGSWTSENVQADFGYVDLQGGSTTISNTFVDAGSWINLYNRNNGDSYATLTIDNATVATGAIKTGTTTAEKNSEITLQNNAHLNVSDNVSVGSKDVLEINSAELTAATITNNGTVNVSGTSTISATNFDSTAANSAFNVNNAVFSGNIVETSDADTTVYKFTGTNTVAANMDLKGDTFRVYFGETGVATNTTVTGSVRKTQGIWIGSDDDAMAATREESLHKVTVTGTGAKIDSWNDGLYMAQSSYVLVENGGYVNGGCLNAHGFIDVTGTGSKLSTTGGRLNGETGTRAQLNVSNGAALDVVSLNIGHESTKNRYADVTIDGGTFTSTGSINIDSKDTAVAEGGSTLKLNNATLTGNTVTNYGTVTMDADSSITAKTVTNSGTVSGSGKFNGTDAADTFTNSKAASMTAAVDMKAGDDTLALNVDSILAGAVDMGEGVDIVNVTGITSLTTDIAGAKKISGQISNAENFKVDDVDMVLGEAKQIAGADTLDDASDDVWAQLSNDADGLIVSWGKSENAVETAVTALDEQKAEMTIGQAVTATIENPAKTDFTKKNNGTLA